MADWRPKTSIYFFIKRHMLVKDDTNNIKAGDFFGYGNSFLTKLHALSQEKIPRYETTSK